MIRPLSATHFKTQTRLPLSTKPSAMKLSAVMGEACVTSFGRFCTVAWRVSPDGIEETSFPLSDAFFRGIRFESALGSLTVHLAMDRLVISAFMEAIMGGSGSEPPYDIGERPLSSIESEALGVACTALAEDIAGALSNHFGRPFSHFPEEEQGVLPPPAQEKATFRYLVNLFGYGGEIRISMPRQELLRQIEAADSESRDAQDSTAHQQLQRQVGRSDVEFSVTLGTETLYVEDIASLRPGQLLALSSSVTTPVRLWSGGVAAYEGTLARSGERLAVCITAAVT
jgi:flagellar motor switch protein FliM